MLELLRLDCVVEMSPTVGQSVPGPRYDCPNGTYSVIQINKNLKKCPVISMVQKMQEYRPPSIYNTVNTPYSEVSNLHYMVNLDEKLSKIFTI